MEEMTLEQQRAIALASARMRAAEAQPSEQPTEAQAQYTDTQKSKSPNSYLQGLRDPIDAGAQMLTHILPQSIVDAGDKFNNWLADKGVPLAKLPERNLSSLVTNDAGKTGVDRLIAQQEKQYQDQRKASGKEGVDWGRLAGNVINPVNIGLAAKVPQVASMAGRVGVGALSGGLFGMAQPVTEGDFWTEKGKQSALGAVTGGALPVLTGAAARVIRPNTSKEVSTLLDEGVTPTIGQMGGKPAKVLEEKLGSVPLIGDVISKAKTRGIEQFNKAAINRSLAPIGEKLPSEVPAGHDAVSYAIDKLSSAYDDLLPKLSGKADTQFVGDLSKIGEMVKSLPEAQQTQFKNIINNEVAKRFTDKGLASGESIKVMESQLNNFARGYKRNPDYNVSQLGSALDEVRSSLRDMVARNNPVHGKELSKINEGYANLMRVQRAASSVAASGEGGVFNPSQLTNAVKAMDYSKNKRAFATGNALMQDLANAGKSVLSPTVPNSGTVDRGMIAWMLTHPISGIGAALGAGAASIPYSPAGQWASKIALTARPEFATPLASAVRQSSPYLAPGAIPLGYGLLNPSQ